MSALAIRLLGGGSLLVAVALLAVSWMGQRRELKVARACERAASAPASVVDVCPAPIRAAVLAQRAAIQCDRDVAGDGATMEWRAGSCLPAIDQLRARALRDQARVRALEADLAAAATRTDAAIVRAERRQATATRQETNARATIDRAPLAGTGLRRCDADCLRALLAPVAEPAARD